MAKPNRGSIIKKTPGWRGTCPLCNRKRVRVLWPYSIGEDKVKICKRCNASANKAS